MRRRASPAGWPAPRAGSLKATGHPLPSSTPGYRFDAHLEGRWEETPSARPHHNPGQAALHHALTLARTVTGAYQLTDVHAAQAHLDTALGTSHDLTDTPVRLLWADIRLTVSEPDRAAVAALQRRQHDEALHAQAQRQRLQAARELHEQLVTTPTLALAYWLTQHPDSTQDSIHNLEELTRQITAYAPDNAWVQVAQVLQSFVHDLAADQRENLVRSLAQIVLRYDQPGLAQQLQHTAAGLAASNGQGPAPRAP
ncbi:hypothetical protein [Streptomyces sp. NPDC046979]|uniref:hypothetical protein n=1 Tax=Streptomyces sp. NPDC046979 TaxID=3154604 RepID=UPI0033EEBEEB